jgi:hypothetical protein
MIASLKKIQPDTDYGVLVVDLSDVAGEGATLRFRQPKAADLFPDAGELKKIRYAYPEYSEPMVFQVQLLGKCYEPEATETPDEAPVKAFADLARVNKTVFFRVLGEFMAYFPMDDMNVKVAEAKNESAE